MTSKTFVSGTTIDSAWLNDVNDATYEGTAVYTPAGTGAVATTVQAELQRFDYFFGRSLESYGAVGDGVTSDSAAWDLAVASGLPILLGSKSYRIGDKGITREKIVILGQQMPGYNAGFTALTGGSILLGSLMVDGNHVRCENFGVDCGITYTNTYTAGAGNNAFVAHNAAQLGVLNKNNHFKNIVGMIRLGDYTDVQAAFHAVLLESLQYGSADNIVGIGGWFGVVLKVSDFQCGKLVGIECDNSNVYIKSNDYGPVARVNVSDIISYNLTSRGYAAVRVESETAELSQVTVNNITVFNSSTNPLTGTNVLVNAASTFPATGVVLGNITTLNGSNGLDVRGPVYGLAANTLTLKNGVGVGISTTANVPGTHPNDVVIGTARIIDFTSGAVSIGSALTKFTFGTINAANAGGVVDSKSVINVQSSSTVGQYVGTLKVNDVVPALVNGWASSFGQATGLVVKSGVTQGYGRISSAASTNDIFMTVPAGMCPDSLVFFSSMQAFDGVANKYVPVTVSTDGAGNFSVYPNRAVYPNISWWDLTTWRFPTEIPTTGGI